MSSNTAKTAPLTQSLLDNGIINEQQLALLGDNDGYPWWLTLLTALAAWIASLFLISALLGPMLAIFETSVFRTIIALLLLAAAWWLSAKPNEFFQQMSVALALASQALLVFVVYTISADNDQLARYAVVAISLVLLFSRLNNLHRHISLAIAAACAVSLVSSAPLLAVIANLLAALSVALWCSRYSWVSLAGSDKINVLLNIATLTSLVLAIAGQHLLVPAVDSGYLYGNTLIAQHLYSALSSTVLLSSCYWLSRTATAPSRVLLLTATLLLCIALYSAPGLLISTAIMLACFYGCSRRWYWLSLLVMLMSLSGFYYDLQVTLLYKSAALAAGGLLALISWLLLQHYQRRTI